MSPKYDLLLKEHDELLAQLQKERDHSAYLAQQNAQYDSELNKAIQLNIQLEETMKGLQDSFTFIQTDLLAVHEEKGKLEELVKDLQIRAEESPKYPSEAGASDIEFRIMKENYEHILELFNDAKVHLLFVFWWSYPL